MNPQLWRVKNIKFDITSIFIKLADEGIAIDGTVYTTTDGINFFSKDIRKWEMV